MLYLVLHTSSTMSVDPAPSHNKKSVQVSKHRPGSPTTAPATQNDLQRRLPRVFNVLCHVDETVSKSCSVTTLFVNEKTYDICVVPPYSTVARHFIILDLRWLELKLGTPKNSSWILQKSEKTSATPAVLGCKSRVHSAAFPQDTWRDPAPRQAVSPRARRSPPARPQDVRQRPDSKCRSEWCAASLAGFVCMIFWELWELLKLTFCT